MMRVELDGAPESLSLPLRAPSDADRAPFVRLIRASYAGTADDEVGTKVGEPGGPPEIVACAWMHWNDESIAAPSLAALKGKVVAVELWATWCGPCVAGIPKLNDLHRKHASDGLVILSVTDQERGAVQRFVEARGEGMSYPIGMESECFRAYGVASIPQAFLIDREGTLIWQGHPSTPVFVEAIENARARR